MRVGGLSTSHMAGMSALWHDPDWDAPVRRFETPLVQKNYDDLPVPTEHHELPDGVKDPFARQEAAYDAAAQQMERGIKGAEFLHGKPKGTDEISKMGQERPVPLDPAKQAQQQSDRHERDHHRKLEAAKATPIATPSTSTKTATQRDADAAAQAGGAAATAALAFAPMAAAQAATTLVQGPLAALASPAITTAGAVMSAAELGMVGIAEATREDEASTSRARPRPSVPDLSTDEASTSSSRPRRGLKR